MITVQPIRYTSRPRQWHRFARALGLAPASPASQVWSEFDGVGVLAVHGVAAGDLRDGDTGFHLRTDDLDAVQARLRGAGVAVTGSTVADVGRLLEVIGSSGARVTVSGGARRAERGELAVLPIWYQQDVAEARRIVEAIGLGPRIASRSESWTDFTGDGGGLAAVHRDSQVAVELAWEYSGDLDAFAVRLDRAGLAAVVVDEAYSRSLRVVSPDGDELWVNATQQDLYGFTRLDTAP